MIAYTEALPLRRTTVWGAFDAPAAIPHVYGFATVTPLVYNAARTQWVLADHAIALVQTVRVDGQVVGNWQHRNMLDNTGHPVALLEFTEAPASAPLVTLRGKISAATGALLVEPAAVVADVISVIAGNPLDPGALAQFAADSTGIELSGSVSGGTLQEVLRDICASIGAIHSPLHPDVCQIHPGGAWSGTTHTVDGRDPAVRVSALTTADETLYTRLRLEFDFAEGAARQHLELAESDAVAQIERTISLPWVQSVRVAQIIGARLLSYATRPRWVYSVSGLPGRVRPGDTLDITTRTVADGDGVLATVRQCRYDPETDTSTVTAADAWSVASV